MFLTRSKQKMPFVLRADSELRRLRLDYNDGLITTEIFERDLPFLEKLSNNKELFLYFYSQYLTASSEPDTRFILFSEGWDRFFSTGRLDWFSSLVVIVFAALIFGKEYEADMRRLQISTSKGDANLVLSKFVVLLSVIIVISLLSFFNRVYLFQCSIWSAKLELPLPKPCDIPELILAVNTISSNLTDILSPTLWFLHPWDHNHFNFDFLPKCNTCFNRRIITRGFAICVAC